MQGFFFPCFHVGLSFIIQSLTSAGHSSSITSHLAPPLLSSQNSTCMIYGQKELKDFLPSLWSSLRREVRGMHFV